MHLNTQKVAGRSQFFINRCKNREINFFFKAILTADLFCTYAHRSCRKFPSCPFQHSDYLFHFNETLHTNLTIMEPEHLISAHGHEVAPIPLLEMLLKLLDGADREV